MEKRFSTVYDTQKGSLSYMEKRSGMREIKVTRTRRGGDSKWEKSSQQSDCYVLSTAWNTQRGSWSYIDNKRGLQPEISSPEETQGTPEMSLPQCTQENERQGSGK